jgi:hypothetical protein
LTQAQEGTIYEHYKAPSLEFALALQERLNLAFDLVDSLKSENVQLNNTNPFKAGDKVLLFNQATALAAKPRKLQFDWQGPFTVIDTPTKSTCNIKNEVNSKMVVNVHVSRLKKFHQQTTNN